jgi:hypothetical protein
MTIICYRNGILAADSGLFWDNAWCGDTQKLFRLDNGLIYGAAGDGDDRRLRHLLGKYANPEQIPIEELQAFAKSDTQALMVSPKRVAWFMQLSHDATHDSYDVEVIRENAKFASIGMGRWIAFGAMAHGASAAEAVAVTVRYAVGTRGPVQTLAIAT